MHPDFGERILILSNRLRECGLPHAFGGAIAYGYYGVPRATNDFDINIFLSEDRAAEVFQCLEAVGVVSNEQSLRTVVATGQVRLDWRNQKVDLFFSFAPLHAEASKRTSEVDMLGTPIPILSSIDIIIFKAIFNRAHDWRDIERIFQQGSPLDLTEINRWLVEILGADDSRIAHLNELAEAHPPR